jgi:hypothetical protein
LLVYCRLLSFSVKAPISLLYSFSLYNRTHYTTINNILHDEQNGDSVIGHEIPNVPGWIWLQNGYYLPMHSDDGAIPFLRKVSTQAQPSHSEMKRIGSNTPLFRSAEQEDVASLLRRRTGHTRHPV